MEPKFQTSFIPKKPIVSEKGSNFSVTRSTNIFSIITTVIFVMTVLTSGALFVYKNILNKQIDEAKTEVANAKESSNPELIQKLIDASKKIKSSKDLLDNLTVRRMRFDDLVYKNIQNVPTITMKGEVQSYNALAQQEQIFNESDFVENPEFSGLSLVENGYVQVGFKAKINPSLVSYKNKIGTSNINQ
jgi:hypothetical protein